MKQHSGHLTGVSGQRATVESGVERKPREFASMSEVRRVATQSPVTLAAEYELMKCQRDRARELLEALLDVWDDGQNPPEHRAYIEGSFRATMEETRKFIEETK